MDPVAKIQEAISEVQVLQDENCRLIEEVEKLKEQNEILISTRKEIVELLKDSTKAFADERSKNTKVEHSHIGPHWRLLEEEEFLEDGDEIYALPHQRWIAWTGVANTCMAGTSACRRRRVESPWIRASERMPTKEDAPSGILTFREDNGAVFIGSWDYSGCTLSAWMPIPPYDPPDPPAKEPEMPEMPEKVWTEIDSRFRDWQPYKFRDLANAVWQAAMKARGAGR